MADVAAARREARRKRILENSHNRLQLISGKSSNDCHKESPVRSYPSEPPQEVPDLSESLRLNKYPFVNGVGTSEPVSFQLPTRHDVDTVAAGDREIGDVVSELANFASRVSTTTETTQPQSVWEKITTLRYDIVLLSIFIQLLHAMSLITFENGYFFVPLIMYSITKLVWSPVKGNSSIANALLLLNGVSPTRVQKVLNIMQYSSVITQDICIFLFATICIQSFYITMQNGFIT